MGCVLSSDWCAVEEVQPVPVARSSSLKRRSLERSDSSRMRLQKVSVRSGQRVNHDNKKKKKVIRGQCGVAGFCFSVSSGNKNSVTDDSFRQSLDEIIQVPCCEKIALEAVLV